MGVERTKDKNIEKVRSKSKVKSQDKHDFRLVTGLSTILRLHFD